MFAAGPVGIRGSTPSQSIGLYAQTMPRVWPIPVTLFRHHLIFTLAIPLSRRRLPLPGLCRIKVPLVSHHRPDDTGGLVGHGDKDDIGRPPRQ